MLTGLNDEGLAVRSVREGAQDYLVKGQVDGNLLVRAMRYAIERKRAEGTLAAEKERLAVTLRSIGDGVITTDAEGRITLVNKVAEALTGWLEEEAIGKSVDEILHLINEETQERCKSPVEEVLEAGRIVNSAVLIARDGTRRIVVNSGDSIRDEDGRIIGTVLVLRDITEKRKIEEELMKIEKLESVGTLAGGIAHDFNNLLTAVLGNISLARMYDSQDKASERLSEAEKALLRARDLTQQLLTFSRGGAPIRKTASIADILRDSATFALSGSSVRCEFFIPDDIWSVEVDEGQIGQVVNNLIINADQAMPGGGVIKVRAENVNLEQDHALQALEKLEQRDQAFEKSLSKRDQAFEKSLSKRDQGGSVPLQALENSRVSGDQSEKEGADAPGKEGRYVKVSIEDQGVGIPQEHLHRIFDPYFTTKQKGSGLGLATSYSIIKNHGGYINVESKLGVGTTFYFYLPASFRQIPAKKEEAEKPIAGRGRILLMDDEEIIRDLGCQMLSHLGYEATAVVDGAEAVELYKKAKESGRPFDAVIMDLTIPGGMGGRIAIQKLIEIDPEVKAIVSSGYSNDPVMSDFRKYGFSGVIAKPYKIKDLSEALHGMLTAPTLQAGSGKA